MQSITAQFEAWVRSKPADEAYNYCDNGSCAFGQFLTETGLAKAPLVGGTFWCDLAVPNAVRADHPFPALLKNALVRGQWTFGALADRLAKVSA